jgi:hypothetical protein
MSENVKEREWLRLVIGVVFVVVVIGAFTFLFRDRSEGTTATSPGFSVVAKDSFGRKAGSIDAGKNTAKWKSVRGGWSVAVGAAFVSEPAPLLNIAALDAGPNASVKAAVSGLGHCGLVANLIDENNYLAIVRIEEYGIWNLEQHVNGLQKVLATVGGSKGVVLNASIAVQAPIVTATVGEKHISVSVSDLVPGRSAGLFAADPNPSECVFDDVVISRPN